MPRHPEVDSGTVKADGRTYTDASQAQHDGVLFAKKDTITPSNPSEKKTCIPTGMQ